jgi:septum formation protein
MAVGLRSLNIVPLHSDPMEQRYCTAIIRTEGHTMKIYLASKSPRRKSLLTQMGVAFELLLVDTPEQVLPNETAEQFSLRVTQEKLETSWDKILQDKLTPMPILCADTEVVLDEKILGKPIDQQDAFNMLKSLSGRTHRVITSVGIKYVDYQKIILNTTLVTFASMPDEAIFHYLSTGDFQDKSGSYGIQSYIGQFISRIEGCFYSVMGLPLNTVRELLEEKQLLEIYHSKE